MTCPRREDGSLNVLRGQIENLQASCAQLRPVQQQVLQQAADLAELMQQTANLEAGNEAMQRDIDLQAATYVL